MKETIKTMINQFGGNKSFYMIGAKNIAYSDADNSLSFKFMRNASQATVCRIAYMEGYDVYNMKFYTAKGREVKDCESLYADQLKSTFSDFTGLALTMPRIVNV
jgi:hypothetical protein